MSEADTATKPQLPFDRIGGREPITRMVNRFYDLMDSEPDFAELRAMHAPDLSPMRESLTDFLMAWMGGPRDWFEKRPGACIMSAHRGLDGMNFAVATQWVMAMQQAAKETIPGDPDFVDSMISAFASMSKGMAANAGQPDDH
ncbi:MAG: group II truncated hemoglobin [Sphingomonadales bacterium]|jgi:hemoglobin|nr:group II truncated hemoglobin [Sphingomonadales bacterium]MBK9004358.1 group II truncated hemoglobin [Sphingomonadales bacterium]MBK9269535.1 group II truncated hemoglobin [Sphingomonadales bacterium]MBP6434336.1 group II truncated hemoglobin [Sphingorhabdus sp.]